MRRHTSLPHSSLHSPSHLLPPIPILSIPPIHSYSFHLLCASHYPPLCPSPSPISPMLQILMGGAGISYTPAAIHFFPISQLTDTPSPCISPYPSSNFPCSSSTFLTFQWDLISGLPSYRFWRKTDLDLNLVAASPAHSLSLLVRETKLSSMLGSSCHPIHPSTREPGSMRSSCMRTCLHNVSTWLVLRSTTGPLHSHFIFLSLLKLSCSP